MIDNNRIRGVLAPVVTPFDSSLIPDKDRFVQHCRWLISKGSGLAVFGTNSEANSLSLNERLELLDHLIDAKIDSAKMMPGTGCCALTDTVQLTGHATRVGCAGVLMLPPFYYKDISEEGLFRYFCEIIERVGDSRLKIYLYHIPQITMVEISLSLVERLLKRYPDVIAGMKDSSGNWENTKNMLDSFGSTGFDMFVGSESFLLQNMRNGGAGCISATANINPSAIDRLYLTWHEDGAEEQQEKLNLLRNVAGQSSMLPALKAVLSYYRNDPAWMNLRPPLMQLNDQQLKTLLADLKKINFSL